MPFIQTVYRFDKRWLEWSGDPNQIPTRDKKYIWVDTYARWRIKDPLLFYQRVTDERSAQSRLDDIVDGETRNVIASNDLIEVVRSTDRAFPETEENADVDMGAAAVVGSKTNLTKQQGRARPVSLIVLMERFAPRYDPLAFTLVEMAAAFAGLLVVAVALGDLSVPRGWTVWGALIVTGVFASALGFLAQTWAQRRTSATRTALAFTLEPVWAALFGFALAGDRLGGLGWGGCALIMAGIVLAEPAAGSALRDALGRRRATKT